MKKDVLPEGVVLRTTETGFEVVSVTGEITCFDMTGRIIKASGRPHKRKKYWLEYFFPMTKSERELVRKWIQGVEANGEKQQQFLDIIVKALEKISYDYSIATIEPSKDTEGKICYQANRAVFEDYRMSPDAWMIEAIGVAHEYESQLANLYELFLWYAYRIAKGWWTLEYVCDNSSEKGNYDNTPGSRGRIEKAGVREVGGFADGVGNTQKLVIDSENKFGYLLCGGFYYEDGDKQPVATVRKYEWSGGPDYLNTFVGCVVLKKVS